MVVSTFKATRKGTGKIKSSLHTGQYAGSVSPDHGQGQTLVEQLALPGVARRINKVICKTTQKRGSGLAIHISGLNSHWLKVEIALEVMLFLAFSGLSVCSCETSLTGRVFVMALSSQGNCNTDLIRAEQVSNTGNWERFWPGSSVAFLCGK